MEPGEIATDRKRDEKANRKVNTDQHRPNGEKIVLFSNNPEEEQRKIELERERRLQRMKEIEAQFDEPKKETEEEPLRGIAT